MKIKILKSCSGYNFSFKQGDTINVEDYIGADLVRCGFAEVIKTVASESKKNPKTNISDKLTVNKEPEENDAVITEPKDTQNAVQKKRTRKSPKKETVTKNADA